MAGVELWLTGQSLSTTGLSSLKHERLSNVQGSIGVQAGCSPCGCDSPAAGEDSGSSSSPVACRGSVWPGGAEDQSSGRQRGSSLHDPMPPSGEPPETTTVRRTHTHCQQIGFGAFTEVLVGPPKPGVYLIH